MRKNTTTTTKQLEVRSREMHARVNEAHKPQTRVEPDGAGQHEKRQAHDEAVAKVQQRGHEADDVQPRVEVENRVREHVPGRGARGQERAPPPVVILKHAHECVFLINVHACLF